MNKPVKCMLQKAVGSLVVGLAGVSAGAALAGVGNEHPEKYPHEDRKTDAAVLAADTRLQGYSLTDMVRLTASFNVTDRSGTPPNTPFQILYGNATNNQTFKVPQGKFLYVPVIYNDDSLPVIGNIPRNVEDHRKLLRYW